MGVFILESTVLTALAGGSFGKLATRLRVVRLDGSGRPLDLLRLAAAGRAGLPGRARRSSTSPTAAACTTWPWALPPFRSAGMESPGRLQRSLLVAIGGPHARRPSHPRPPDRRPGRARARRRADRVWVRRLRLRPTPRIPRPPRPPRPRPRPSPSEATDEPSPIDDGAQVDVAEFVDRLQAGIDKTEVRPHRLHHGRRRRRDEGRRRRRLHRQAAEHADVDGDRPRDGRHAAGRRDHVHPVLAGRRQVHQVRPLRPQQPAGLGALRPARPGRLDRDVHQGACRR